MTDTRRFFSGENDRYKYGIGFLMYEIVNAVLGCLSVTSRLLSCSPTPATGFQWNFFIILKMFKYINFRFYIPKTISRS